MGVASLKFGLSLHFGSNPGYGSIRKLLQAHPVRYSGGFRFFTGAPKSANRSCGLKVNKNKHLCEMCYLIFPYCSGAYLKIDSTKTLFGK